jgi:hypothetical protein
MKVPNIQKLKAIREENAQLKTLAANQALKISLLEDMNPKKMVRPSAHQPTAPLRCTAFQSCAAPPVTV